MVRKKISPWTKNNIREIKHTLERYIAILAIIALGVAFFSGLVITRDAMVTTLDKYLTDNNMYDYRLLSTVAFDKDDSKDFNKLDEVAFAEGAISIDFLGTLPDYNQTIVIKAHSITNEINKLQLVSGRMPQKPNETVVDSLAFSEDSIGQKIKISPENEDDTIESFSSEEYTIVGRVQSVEYTSGQRGTTNLANGSINAFIYIPEDGFDINYYTEIYVKLNEHVYPYSDQYEDYIDSNEEAVKVVLDESANSRFDQVIDDANEEIDQGEREYEDGYNEYLLEKEKAIKELDDAYASLVSGQEEIDNNEDQLINAENELAKGQKDYTNGLKGYEDGLEEYQSSKANTLQTLEDSQKEIDTGRAQVNAGISEIENSQYSDLIINYDEQILGNINQLEVAKKEIENRGVLETYMTLQDSLTQLNTAKEEIDKSKPQVEAGIAQIENSQVYSIIQQYDNLSEGINYYNNLKQQMEENPALLETQEYKEIVQIHNILLQYQELKTSLSSMNDLLQQREDVIAGINEIEVSNVLVQYDNISTNLTYLQEAKSQIDESGVRDTYSQLQESLGQLDDGQATLDASFATANQEFTKAEEELAQAKNDLDDANKLLTTSQKEINDGKEALEKGKTELADGFKEYEEGKAEAEEGFADAEEEFADARLEIDDGKKEVANLIKPTTYIFNRDNNSGYASFDNDSAIVAGIAKVLPIFFFLVAALVCSTTMSRMVDEQRGQIGTLKALGYSDNKITNKYVFYAGSAAIIGCIVGYFLGTKFFPMAIWTAYGMLYKFSPIVYIFDWKLAIISLIVSLLCSAGVTYITCKRELTSTPADLIRPKSPKPGKRIFLEGIPSIWNRLSFLRKVSIRNILRYKKRLLMTVMGVAGCTALIITALGIEDSIANIANYQFDDIMDYDYEIYFKEELSDDDKNEFKDKYQDILSESVFVAKETSELITKDRTKTFNIVATDDPDISNLIDLHMEERNIPYPKDGQVALSHKLADEAGVSEGDSVTIKVSDTKEVEATVGGIFENYIDNYMYMTSNTYETLFNEEPKYLNALAASEEEDLNHVAETLTAEENVSTTISTQSIRDIVDDMMTSLNYVIWVVLGFAVALAFVVVYNLNNINITERAREIATLKVLGFYEEETHIYVYRENIVLTILGIILGLFLGKWLLIFVMDQIQVDFVAFKQQVFPQSYLIAFFATLLITLIVNKMLQGKIDNISMAESLNSGE